MDVKRIKVEGRRRDPARNRRRVVVELTTSVRGVVVEGHHVTGPDPVPSHETPEPRTSQIEVYVDRLPAVAERVQTATQLALYAQAKQISDLQTDVWLKANEKRMRDLSPEQKKTFTHRNCNIRPMTFAHLVDLKEGLPPIEKMDIVSNDGETVIPYADFAELDAESRNMFLLAPPRTDSNELERTGQIMADAMMRGMEAAAEKAAAPSAPRPKNKPGK